MLPFDAILFDVGGVLLTNGWAHHQAREGTGQFHVDAAAFEARHSGFCPAWSGTRFWFMPIWTRPSSTSRAGFSHERFSSPPCAPGPAPAAEWRIGGSSKSLPHQTSVCWER